MKRLYYFIPLFLMMLVFASCMDKYTEVFKANNPIYLSYEELRSVKTTEATPLKKPGKIYFKDHYLYIVEMLEGVHVIDVSNASNPKNLKFIKIPGCVDIAIRNNTMYVDSYIDLVTLDISDIHQTKELARLKEVFPYTIPPTNNNLRTAPIDTKKGIVVGWNVETTRQDIKYLDIPVYAFRPDYLSYSNGADKFLDSGSSSSSGSNAATFGKSGSMARFGITDSYLYVADPSSVTVFSLDNPNVPVKQNKQYLGWNMETMFLYDKHMFLGTSNGMIICSLENPLVPKQINSYWHVTSCDPVVVEDGYAYVTLRSGVNCRNTNVNELDVLQLSNGYKTIQLVQSYSMSNPHGLGIDGKTLFVCDGAAGLKVYDCSDKKAISSHQLATFPSIQATDVIPLPSTQRLFMIGEGGFYFYDYSDVKNIKLLSKIEVVK